MFKILGYVALYAVVCTAALYGPSVFFIITH
jgi:hypothetical protein